MAMENLERENICPRCGAAKMNSWSELSEEQKFLVERTSRNTEFPNKTRKTHRFCTRCWFEETEPENQIC